MYDPPAVESLFLAQARAQEFHSIDMLDCTRGHPRQRKLREAAQEEAERAKEEVELLRKQIAAMDDRMKASSKLEHRQKMAAVEAVLAEVIGAAVDTVEAWWEEAAAAEDDAVEEQEEEEEVVLDDEVITFSSNASLRPAACFKHRVWQPRTHTRMLHISYFIFATS